MQFDLFNIDTKYCYACKQERPKTDFYKDKSRKDGLDSRCKPCHKKYYEDNKDKLREYWKKRYEDNKDKLREYSKEYYEDNREYYKEYGKEYRKNKRHLENARKAKRRAAKLEATPDWLTDEQLNEIKNIYWLAQDLKKITGEDYHVDHIIPLQGEEVRGLHVPWNLQVLPADINLSKGNRIEDGSTET